LFAFKLSIGKIGIAGVPLYTNEAIAGINTNDDNIVINKYLYYYLYNTDFKNLASGILGNVGSLNKKILEELEIHIPVLEVQSQIVEYLDMIYEKIVKLNNEKIENIKKLNKQYLNMTIQHDTKKEFKKLGEVCEVSQGTYIKSDMKIDGIYPVYGGGNISYYINQYNREDEIVIAKDGISLDCVRYIKDKFFLNHHGWTLTINQNIIKKYIYYYLYTNNHILYDIAQGSAQLGINQENFYKLEIPIPTIEKQKELVEYLEFNDNLIKTLEQEIEINKNKAELLFKEIIYNP